MLSINNHTLSIKIASYVSISRQFNLISSGILSREGVGNFSMYFRGNLVELTVRMNFFKTVMLMP